MSVLRLTQPSCSWGSVRGARLGPAWSTSTAPRGARRDRLDVTAASARSFLRGVAAPSTHAPGSGSRRGVLMAGDTWPRRGARPKMPFEMRRALVLGIGLLAACGGSSSHARRAPADPPRSAGPMCSELAVADEDARILELTPSAAGEQLPAFLRVGLPPPREAARARVHEQLGAHVAIDFLEEGRVVRARSRDARAARAACALAQDELTQRRRELAQRTLGFLTEQLSWVYAQRSEARSVADFYRREHGTPRDREARMRADLIAWLDARFAEEQRRRDRGLSAQSVCTQPAPCRAR